MMKSNHFRTKIRLALSASLCLTSVVPVFGQKLVILGGGLTTTSVKDEAAGAQGIGTRGWGFQFNAIPRVYRNLTFGFDFGLEFFGDKEQFTVGTTGGTRKSSANMLYGAAAAGILIPPLHFDPYKKGASVAAGMNVGTDWVSGLRSVTDCANCPIEDLDLRGGLYLEPSLNVLISGRSGLNLSYRKYRDQSDIRDRLLVQYIHLVSLSKK